MNAQAIDLVPAPPFHSFYILRIVSAFRVGRVTARPTSFSSWFLAATNAKLSRYCQRFNSSAVTRIRPRHTAAASAKSHCLIRSQEDSHNLRTSWTSARSTPNQPAPGQVVDESISRAAQVLRTRIVQLRLSLGGRSHLQNHGMHALLVIRHDRSPSVKPVLPVAHPYSLFCVSSGPRRRVRSHLIRGRGPASNAHGQFGRLRWWRRSSNRTFLTPSPPLHWGR